MSALVYTLPSLTSDCIYVLRSQSSKAMPLEY